MFAPARASAVITPNTQTSLMGTAVNLSRVEAVTTRLARIMFGTVARIHGSVEAIKICMGLVDSCDDTKARSNRTVAASDLRVKNVLVCIY